MDTDGTLRRRMSARHFLRRPPAIAFDRDVIDQAHAVGAERIVCVDRDSGDAYAVTMDAFMRGAFAFNRGWGDQLALPLAQWARSRVEAPATFQDALSGFLGDGADE